VSRATQTHTDAAARFQVVVARLVRQLRQQTLGDLTLTQWSALGSIETHAPLRLMDLADREGVSAATATRVVASLEERGLLRRECDAADRRSSLVSLSAAGRRQLERMRTARTARLAQRLSQLPDADLRRLVDVLPLLESLAADDR
jgi:DNA-binding MarR family transcriptional regulator